MLTYRTVYRCTCGHFEEEHKQDGCAGCDNGERELSDICPRYSPDLRCPELIDADGAILP